jgi:hypothetical protein
MRSDGRGRLSAELHAMMLHLQNEVQQQKQGEQLAVATQGLSLQMEPGNQVIPLANLQPALAANNTGAQGFAGPNGADALLLRGAGARQEEEQDHIGYGSEDLEDLSQEIFPFGFPALQSH